MKRLQIGVVALVAIVASDAPAIACSCVRVLSFEEEIRSAPVVVVGTVTLTGQVPPPLAENQSDRVTVHPAFMGSGVTMTLLSVAKGVVVAKDIRIWSFGFGECAGALSTLKSGQSIVIALRPVGATPAAMRAGWGAVASTIPDVDYYTSSGCSNPLKLLSAGDLTRWIGRSLP